MTEEQLWLFSLKFQNPFEKFEEFMADQSTQDAPSIDSLSPDLQKWYRA